MKRELYALLTAEPDDVTLASLGRAIAYAPRSDGLPVWRAFVRSRGDHFVSANRTQRIRARIGGGGHK